jgi:ArsR family transcriptional regulator
VDQMVSTINIEQAAKMLKLLGDKTRLSIMCLLNKHECCVCEFVEIFQISQPSVSQHLRKLKDGGLIQERRKGQWMYYSLTKDKDVYPLVQFILINLPDLQTKIYELEKNGLRVKCE